VQRPNVRFCPNAGIVWPHQSLNASLKIVCNLPQMCLSRASSLYASQKLERSMAVGDLQKPPLWLGLETLTRGSLRGLLLLVGALVVASILGWHVYETRFYRAKIPAEIGLTFDFATTSSDTSLWDLFSIAPIKACGGAILKLSDTAAAVISERGLDYLKDARQGRGHTDKQDLSFQYHSYRPWQATPVPSQWTELGPWLGLNCMRLRTGVKGSIMEAAQKTGAFYTTGLSKILLVVPGLRMAVLTYTR
jgi:hypothetical protein